MNSLNSTIHNYDTSSLSSFTKARNIIVTNQIQKYDQSYNKPDKNDLAIFTTSKEKDPIKDLLKVTKREIRKLNLQLSSVLSNGEYHILLEPGNSVGVEVIENTYAYLRVPCKF